VWSSDEKEKVGMVSENWILHGIGFKLSNGYISIFNALDTNGINITREENENIRYIAI
jgi:hypothetical protein